MKICGTCCWHGNDKYLQKRTPVKYEIGARCGNIKSIHWGDRKFGVDGCVHHERHSSEGEQK